MSLLLSFLIGVALGAGVLAFARRRRGKRAEGVSSLGAATVKAVFPETADAGAKAIPEVLLESSVDDVMIPRLSIAGVDLSDGDEEIRRQIIESNHRFLPAFDGGLDKTLGILDLRDALGVMPDASAETIKPLLRPAYYVPSGAPLLKQWGQFLATGQTMALVVDEYGEIEGLATRWDVIHEIIAAEFEGVPGLAAAPGATRALPAEGAVLDAGISLRALNRRLGSDFPLDAPAKTLAGLITETLGEIPEEGSKFDFYGYRVEVLQTRNHAIRVVKLTSTGTKEASEGAAPAGSSLQMDN